MMMRKLIFKILRFSGLPTILRQTIQQNKVTILLFHDISTSTAQKTFEYLSEKYNIIGLSVFIESCKKKEKKLPKKSLIITFDDGCIGNYDLLEVVKKQRIPITVFLCAGLINTNRHYWFKLEHPKYTINDLEHLPNGEKLKILSEVGFSQEKNYPCPQALTKANIDEMRQYVDFQSHTMFHPCLPQCNDVEATAEIVDSKVVLEERYGLKVNVISYPNGDYSEREIQLCKLAGYESAITVDPGYNTTETDLFKLKRLSVNDSDDINEVVVKASGLWTGIKSFLQLSHG